MNAYRILWMAALFGVSACDDGGGSTPADMGADAALDPDDGVPPPDPDDGVPRDSALPDAGPVGCDPAVERCPPANPVCYTPCRGDVREADGTLRRCAQDGLLEGCLAGAVCDRGTCVAVNPTSTTLLLGQGECMRDSECADFQTCIQGRCYSECVHDGECNADDVCHRRVCRRICNEEARCAEGTVCDDGICKPLAAPGEEPISAEAFGFKALPPLVAFSNSSTDGVFTLHNSGLAGVVLTVEKWEERRIGPGGPERITENPLRWLRIEGEEGPVEITVPAGGASDVRLSAARNPDYPRWEGRLRITGGEAGVAEVSLAYSEEVGGRWVGTAYVFGNFNDGARPGLRGSPLDTWMADRSDTGQLTAIPNAFLRAWGQYRSGRLDLDELGALIDATLTGSWDSRRVRELCLEEGFGANARCAPFGGSGSRAVIPYTSDVTTVPVPSGVVETDFALHLVPGGECAGGDCFTGRIDTASALQYGGNPQVTLSFVAGSTECDGQADDGCRVFIDQLDAEIGVGGRYTASDGCAEGFQARTVPWLVPGFTPPGGGDELSECRDQNIAFAGGNPIPDGQPRRRRLELVDGVMVEQRHMTLLLRETVDPFHGGEEGLKSYMYVVLQREAIPLEPEDAAGNAVPDTADMPRGRALTCSPDLLDLVGGAIDLSRVPADRANDLAQIVVTGATGAPEAPIDPAIVHSMCVWTEDVAEGVSRRRELIDAGPDGDTPCFPGAQIFYFTAEGDPQAWACNAPGQETCLATLRNRVRGSTRLSPQASAFIEAPAAHFSLLYGCVDPNRASCDDNRFDLRDGKTFFSAGGDVHAARIETDIAQAFRYKSRFVSRSGSTLGFAPEICVGGSDLRPYCYDPVGIQSVRERVDCAMALYHTRGDLTPETRATLRGYLRKNFSALQQDNPTGDPVVEFGFERLDAELKIMLGDEAYTASFASRFDLAANSVQAFEGSRFEPGGADLSGALGYEMDQLHRAAQYYDLVLDRFYAMSRWLWGNLDTDGDRYVVPATVTTYLDRVIRASTQSARVWSEVAARYQGINRADLARRVLERAYTRSYQESLVLGAFMKRMTEVVGPEAVPEVARALDDAQRRYRVALLDMRRRYRELSSSNLFFGLPPEFIPFPALDEDAVNGFEVMLERTRERLDAAMADEDTAIESRRDFDTDQESFQSELVSLRQTYEADLGGICGTFLGEDGRTYPAIPRYAHLMAPEKAALDDPCGSVGNGSLWLAGSDLQTLELELRRVRQEAVNAQAEIADTLEYIGVQCDMIEGDVGRFLQDQGAVDQLETHNDRMTSAITQLDKTHEMVSELSARFADISDTGDAFGFAALGIILVKSLNFGIFATSAAVNFIATSSLEAAINLNQESIRNTERTYEAFVIGRECDYLQLEGVYTIRAAHRQLLLTELDVLNALWNVQVGVSNIQSIANERNRLETEWRDTEQLSINVAAAQNDPNVRIFKNDAILNADRTFARAQQAAWALTRIYEYYTATSYPEREQLFLARMVRAGDINLLRYVNDLEDAFFAFEQDFGNPDTRVERISVRDDILQIPYVSEGVALCTQERVTKLRERLQSPSLLDDNGALTMQFSTSFDRLSRRTVNHKILFIEVEIFGEDLGDHVGRIYLRQKGTGVVEGTDGTRRFFTFPPRTAVMNPFFNGERAFGQDSDGAITGPVRSIYRSYRFRERPFVQSDWELVIDQRGEQVNQDINLGSVDDVVIYIYYTDFTRD